MTVQVKICGITRIQDALVAVEAGADALGFMFYQPSARYITPAAAEKITRELPPAIARVGVFVDASPEFILEAASRCGLTMLQLHGSESPEFCRQFSLPILKAFRIKDNESLRPLPSYNCAGWLLDSYVAGQSGGTGEKFNWQFAIAARRLGGGKIWLAGGLTPGNVAEAIRQVQPFAVDVSSGVESAPGLKDPAKIRQFLRAAKVLLA